ncbi:MAG: FHA domain-containing protein [Candidatus Syntrophopropionicum ammoniitolerans]
MKAGLREKIFNLNKDSIVIGRREGCDIVLDDDSISRRHARLDLSRGVYLIHDLDSTNYAKVNGERITTRTLKSGDVLTFGVQCVHLRWNKIVCCSSINPALCLFISFGVFYNYAG